MRTIRYQEIAHTLRQRVQAEGPGHVLPSESDLSSEFGVSRVTIRRALETLRDEGVVESRQGFASGRSSSSRSSTLRRTSGRNCTANRCCG